MDFLYIYYETMNNLNENTNYISTMTNQFDKYKEYIQSFFVGKKEEIKSIYSGIRFNKFISNKITSIDVNIIRHIYSDYFSGLVEFAEKIASLCDTDDISIESVKLMIDKVSKRDFEFVESLFNGTEVKLSEMDIDTAMKNIEVLIDFNSDINVFEDVISKLSSTISSNNTEKYKECISDGMLVFLKSISTYMQKYVEAIENTYNCIHDSISKGKFYKETPKYQLF